MGVICMDVMYADNVGAVIGDLLCLPHPWCKSRRDFPSLIQNIPDVFVMSMDGGMSPMQERLAVTSFKLVTV